MEVTLAYLSEKFGVADAVIVSALYAVGIDPVGFGEAGQAISYPEAALDFLLSRFDPVQHGPAIKAQSVEVIAERPAYTPAQCRAKLVPNLQELTADAE